MKPSNFIASELVKSISAIYLGDLTLARFVGNHEKVQEEEKMTTTTEHEETERLQLPGGECREKKKMATRVRFELTRAEPIRLAV